MNRGRRFMAQRSNGFGPAGQGKATGKAQMPGAATGWPTAPNGILEAKFANSAPSFGLPNATNGQPNGVIRLPNVTNAKPIGANG